jgi:alpha 1,2-mannosyltransferase
MIIIQRRVSVLTDSKMEFGLIPREHWFQPAWIDEERAAASRQKMADENVIYGGLCRFYLIGFMIIILLN